MEFVDERDLSPLLTVGGRWDRKAKDWSDDEPRTALQVTVHPGQLESVRFFAQWIEAKLLGKPLAKQVFSTLLLGGTRSGKTFIGDRLAVAYGIAFPGSKIWIIGENKEDGIEELETDLDSLLPESWATKTAKKYKLVNASIAHLRSGKYPHKLKRGECSFAFLNEGQNQPLGSFLRCRERTADSGGFVMVAANPPNEMESGEWIGEWATEYRAGRRDGTRVFHYHPKDNPHISQEHLEGLKAETDPRTYAIEVLGEVRPAVNAVYHSFDQLANVDAWPELPGFDVTAEFAKRAGIGRNMSHMVGLDFQRTPHMAAVIAKASKNINEEDRPMIYYIGEVVVDLGDEYDLSDGLYDYGLDPKTTALVGDASGEFQDADRTVQGSSFRILKECGWRVNFPDRIERRNPKIASRMKNDNRLFLSEAGERLVMIDPVCTFLLEAIKKWRRKGGIPNRGAKWAHICDAMSYLNWRLYPRRIQKQADSGYKSLKRRSRRDQFRGW